MPSHHIGEAEERPHVPDLGDVSTYEMMALKVWHQEQADKMELAVREHRTRAEHLNNAIKAKGEGGEI